MARFDIYPNPVTPDRSDFPFVLQIQSDFLYRFVERVCVPLVRRDVIPGMTQRFNPPIEVSGEVLRLHPLGVSVFYASELRTPVASVKNEVPDIEDALDMLLRGY